jgi:hypothetical protein
MHATGLWADDIPRQLTLMPTLEEHPLLEFELTPSEKNNAGWLIAMLPMRQR